MVVEFLKLMLLLLVIIHLMIFLQIDIGEYKCMIVDPIVVVEKVEITKKKGKKAYELNRHFQDN